jgi:glycosyltransferase involved in cell wall biosynthesis
VRERIRVLEFITSFFMGGTERQFVNLLDGLRGSEFEVHVACFKAEGVLRSAVETDGVPFREYRVSSLRSPAVVARLASLVRYLRRHSIDVVHATGPYPNVLGVTAGWLAGTPAVIASVRDLGHMWGPGLWRMQRQVCRLADTVVVNAEAVADRLRSEGYDPAKIEVIRNGIISAEQEPPRPGGAGLRRELGIPERAPLVGVICRLDRIKRLEDFVDAAAALAPRHPEARFVVVGGPFTGDRGTGGRTYMAELRDRAQRLGVADRVILTGARTDVPALLPELTVSVLPSASEGLSNALLESMAAGLPVVATAVGGTPEIVDDGATGLLVPPAEPAALAAAIGRLLDDPELGQRLGSEGRRRVELRYTRERMVGDTMDLYRRLLRRTPLREAAVRPGVAPR